MNKVIILGNLGADPEIKTFGQGRKFATFQVATNKRYQKNGEWKTQVYWHKCVCFDTRAELAEKALYRGCTVLLEGELTYRTVTNKNGLEVEKAEIQLFSFKVVGGKKRPEKKKLSEGEKMLHGIDTDLNKPGKSTKEILKEKLQKQKEIAESTVSDLPF